MAQYAKNTNVSSELSRLEIAEAYISGKPPAMLPMLTGGSESGY